MDRGKPFVASLALGVGLLGCIVIADQSPTGDQFTQTCTLANASSPCGACMTNMCASELSACCADTACRSVLAAVDQCADAGQCIFDMSEKSAGALGTCIETHCASNCTIYDGGTNDTGTAISCSLINTDPPACFCSATSNGGNATCDLTTFASGICCASAGWPAASGSSCNCAPISCKTEAGGSCMCSPDEITSTVSCDDSVGLCCTSDGFCECDPNGTECVDGQSVSDCHTAQAVGCTTDETAVTSCSSP